MLFPASSHRLLLSCRRIHTHRAVAVTRALASLSPLQSRDKIRQSLPLETFNVAGVTFQGRQETLSELESSGARPPVMLVKEPDNPHDSSAVAVRLLSGTPLGYVPRPLTSRFIFPTTFGQLRSVALAPGTDKLGANVAVRPSLAPLALVSLPEPLQQYRDPEAALSPEDYTQLQERAAKASRYRCFLCGGLPGEGAEWPVHPVPRWHLDTNAAVLRLVGAHNVCEELLLPAERGSDAPGGARGDAAPPESLAPPVSLGALAQVNRWSKADAEQYAAWLLSEGEARSEKVWEVDLSWLKS